MSAAVAAAVSIAVAEAVAVTASVTASAADSQAATYPAFGCALPHCSFGTEPRFQRTAPRQPMLTWGCPFKRDAPFETPCFARLLRATASVESIIEVT